MNKLNIGIPANNLSLGTSLFISIYKTLNINGYKCYFINPNKIVQYTLKKKNIPFLILSRSEQKSLTYKKTYKNIKNDKIQEHIRILQTYFGKPGYKKVLLQYLKDYEESKYLIKKYNIQALLIHNGYYQISKVLGNDIGLKIIYFENGYFGNDIQIDTHGINAQMSIAKKAYKDFIKIKKSPNKKIKKVFVEESQTSIPFFVYLFLGFISVHIRVSYIFLIFILQKKYCSIKRSLILKKEKYIKTPTQKFIFIAFQVHDDTQIVFNSKIIKSMNEILDFFYNDIKKILPEYKIVVKEHPMDIGRIKYSNTRKKYNDIIWIKKGNINELIEKCEYLICVNSSVGLQGLAQYKKVLTLGENFYSRNPWVQNIHHKDEFREKLSLLKHSNINKSKKSIDKYIDTFKKEIFISGGWYNFNKKTIKEICDYITQL